MSTQQNKLATMPIGRLVISMSVPIMISYFVQAMYNIVDSMFVAKISEDALTAVSIAFPVQQAITALSVGTAVSLNALVPRFMGQGRKEDALRVSNVAVFLAICFTVIFFIIGTTFVPTFYRLQTNIPTIVDAGIDYLTIVCTVSVGVFLGQLFEKLLVATGNTVSSMITQAGGAIFNLIFDPLLIFGIGPFPELGVRGAAIATVSGQIFSALLGIVLLYRKEKYIRLRLRYMLPRLSVLKQIFSVAIPSMVTIGISSVMSFFFNQILLAFSTTATAVFGIWLKLQHFSYMPIFGLNNGIIPIMSYNYGAGNMDRVKKTMRVAISTAVILMLALMVVFEFIPHIILFLFSASDSMLSIGVIALRFFILTLPLGAASIILTATFQALDRNRYTLTVNLCRQLVIFIPIAYLMSLTGKLSMVWIAAPISDSLSLILAIFFMIRLRKLRNM